MFSWITDEPLAILDLTDVHPRQFAQCYAGASSRRLIRRVRAENFNKILKKC
jgi:hypothetical protein